MGHNLKLNRSFGSLQVAEVQKLNQVYFGFSDPRSEGSAAIGLFQ